jgi:hypothetical protein
MVTSPPDTKLLAIVMPVYTPSPIYGFRGKRVEKFPYAAAVDRGAMEKRGENRQSPKNSAFH